MGSSKGGVYTDLNPYLGGVESRFRPKLQRVIFEQIYIISNTLESNEDKNNTKFQIFHQLNANTNHAGTELQFKKSRIVENALTSIEMVNTNFSKHSIVLNL